MKRRQYNELVYGRRTTWGRRAREKLSLPVVITGGKHAGRVGLLVSAANPKLGVQFPDEEAVIGIHYSDMEECDPDGKPIYYPMLDMTGREITDGCWLVYSIASGRNSHALEMGRVCEITKTGAIKVSRELQNGTKVVKHSNPDWNLPKTVNDPDRALMLPVEVSTLTMWVLKDFEGLKEE